MVSRPAAIWSSVIGSIMTISKKPSRCRWAIVLICSAAILLAVAWYFAGYVPDSTIPLSSNWPLAVMKDGKTLILGSPGDGAWGFTPHIIGPIRFVDLATGKELQAPLELKEVAEEYLPKGEPPPNPRTTVDNRPIVLTKSENCQTTIAGISLSDDERRLAVLRISMFNLCNTYYATVFDLSTRKLIFDKAIPFRPSNDDWPAAQLSPDGHLLAWANGRVYDWRGDYPEHWTTGKDLDGSIVVWDLDKNKERYRVSSRAIRSGFQFSPDGKLLASCTWPRVSPGSERLQLSDAETGTLLHSVEVKSHQDYGVGPPIFSPNSRFVSLENLCGQGFRVIDTSSGQECFQTMGWSPQFLHDGLLLAATDNQLSVWNCADWTTKPAVACDLDASPPAYDLGTYPPFARSNRSIDIPPFFPIGRGNEFAVLHETGGVWTLGSAWGCEVPWVRALRWLGFNVPGGMRLDVVDATTGAKRTYNLDSDSARWFPFPQHGMMLNPQNGEVNCVFPVPAIKSVGGQRIIPYAGDSAAVWSIPPRRSYRAVAVTAGILAAIRVMAYALILLARFFRRAARRDYDRQQADPL
jgi:hypothetical protein